MANVKVLVAGVFGTDDRAACLAAAEATLAKALSLAPNHAYGHFALGALYMFSNRASQAVAEFEHALTLDRNLAFAHSLIGTAKIYLGHAEETEAHVQKALRISPRDSNAYHWTSHAGRAKFYLGCDEEAVAWYRRSIEANPNFSVVRFLLAGALAQLGRLDEAQAAARAGLALDPNFTIRGYRAVLTGLSAHPTAVAQSERLCDGMRKAGVPEG